MKLNILTKHALLIDIVRFKYMIRDTLSLVGSDVNCLICDREMFYGKLNLPIIIM